MKWYIVHTYSGCEYFVKETLEKKILEKKMEHNFGRILVPTEESNELNFNKKNEIKKEIKKKMFPGYIVVEMVMNDPAWYLIKNISKVIGFIGGHPSKPIPISENEVISILDRVDKNIVSIKPKKVFKLGEMIKVISGPFSDFSGTVEEINYNKNRLSVSVLIFGRPTPIDLDFNQVDNI